jgi:hypothetical protein
MIINNIKKPNGKRNESEAPVQCDVKSIGMRAVTERRGRNRESTHHTPFTCVPESIIMYGGFCVNRS